MWNTDRVNTKSLIESDIMISDFSGIIFDYYTLFKKPILTINSQYEKRGREAMDLKDDSWDIKSLDIIGKSIKENDVKDILNIVDTVLEENSNKNKSMDKVQKLMDLYPGESKLRGTKFIKNQLKYLAAKENNPSEHDVFQDSSILESELIYNKTKENILVNTWKSMTNVNSLFQFFIGSVYFTSLLFLLGQVTPSFGLNHNFIFSLKKPAILLCMFLYLVFFIGAFAFNKKIFTYKKEIERFDILNFGLIFIPMLPIIQYVLLNQDILKVPHYLLQLI